MIQMTKKNSSNEAFNSSNKKVVQMSKTIKFKLTKWGKD